jgi:hypothetical protein
MSRLLIFHEWTHPCSTPHLRELAQIDLSFQNAAICSGAVSSARSYE